MTIKVTLQVPEAVYRLAQKTAKATSRPVEKVLADVVLAASPVSDDLSPELRKELDTLARLRTSALWTLADKLSQQIVDASMTGCSRRTARAFSPKRSASGLRTFVFKARG
jgi:hypothetical protein